MHSGAPGELSGGAALRVSTSLDRDGQLRVERVAPVVVQADEVDAGRQLGAQVRVTPLTGAVVAVVDLVHLPRRGEQPEHPVTVGGHRVEDDRRVLVELERAQPEVVLPCRDGDRVAGGDELHRVRRQGEDAVGELAVRGDDDLVLPRLEEERQGRVERAGVTDVEEVAAVVVLGVDRTAADREHEVPPLADDVEDDGSGLADGQRRRPRPPFVEAAVDRRVERELAPVHRTATHLGRLVTRYVARLVARLLGTCRGGCGTGGPVVGLVPATEQQDDGDDGGDDEDDGRDDDADDQPLARAAAPLGARLLVVRVLLLRRAGVGRLGVGLAARVLPVGLLALGGVGLVRRLLAVGRLTVSLLRLVGGRLLRLCVAVALRGVLVLRELLGGLPAVLALLCLAGVLALLCLAGVGLALRGALLGAAAVRIARHGTLTGGARAVGAGRLGGLPTALRWRVVLGPGRAVPVAELALVS